jgi:hypothetical protein
MTAMETKKRSDGDAVVFMALMFLCRFLLFGMSELEWILLVKYEAGELSSNGGAYGNFIVERKKEKQQKEINGEGDGFCFGEVFKEGKLDF